MNIPILRECEDVLSRSAKRIVCEENNQTLTFLNPKARIVSKYSVDKCPALNRALGSRSPKLCDFLIIDWRGEEHYVELKSGSHAEDALAQIESTIQVLRSKENKADLFGWILARGIPSNSSRFGDLKKRFRQFFEKQRIAAHLQIRKSRHQHDLEKA